MIASITVMNFATYTKKPMELASYNKNDWKRLKIKNKNKISWCRFLKELKKYALKIYSTFRSHKKKYWLKFKENKILQKFKSEIDNWKFYQNFKGKRLNIAYQNFIK